VCDVYKLHMQEATGRTTDAIHADFVDTLNQRFSMPLMIVVVIDVVVIDIIGVIVTVIGMHHADFRTICPFDAPAASI